MDALTWEDYDIIIIKSLQSNSEFHRILPEVQNFANFNLLKINHLQLLGWCSLFYWVGAE